MPKWSSYIPIALFVLFFVLIGCIFGSQFIGEKAVSSDSAAIPPNGQKTYNLPPGYVTVSITSDTPVNLEFGGLGVSGGGHNLRSNSIGIGSAIGATYTVINPAGSPANVNVHMTTGVLNPFGYF